MPEFKRSARVSESVRMELSAILQDGLIRDPHVGYVTVTDVVVTDDLRQAKCYVSVYGEGDVREKSIAALRRAAPFLRRELAPRLRLRFTPELEFVLDESQQRGARIDTLLTRIAKGETEDLEVAPLPGALKVSSGADKAPLVIPPPPAKKKAPSKKRRRR